MQDTDTQTDEKKTSRFSLQISDFARKFKKDKSEKTFRLPKVSVDALKSRVGNTFRFAKSHKKVSAGVIVVTLLIVFVAVAKVTGNNPQAVVGGAASAANSQNNINVNRRFEIPIKTKDGTETGEKLAITITNVEKTPSILIQNKPAKTKEGKTFLVINIEIQNDTKKQLNVRPIDMVRLVGTDGRNYAPDVHNNEVPSEPVSLKKTRVGYVVDEGQNKFKLLIGEVRSSQETIEIEF